MREKLRKTDFPARDGWVQFENRTSHAISVCMEPSGIGEEIPMGKKAYILVLPENNNSPFVIIHDDCLQIYCAEAMYIDGIEVIDMS